MAACLTLWRAAGLLAALAAAVSSAAPAGPSAATCEATGAAGAAGCMPSKDSVLLQTKHDRALRTVAGKVDAAVLRETPAAIRSGDVVFLKVKRTGKRFTVESTGMVHAKWNQTGSWQELTIVRVSGSGTVMSGDTVRLRGKWGNPLTVQNTTVHAMWNQSGTWQNLVIETKAGGAIAPGSTVFLRAHTGARVDADAPDGPGKVQARWTQQGSWQELVIEAKSMAPVPAPPAPTPTPAPTPAPTTPPPTSAPGCVAQQSLGKCAPCLKSEQCGEGRYCCPYMKKCVINSQESCALPIAGCQPMCWDSMDNKQCTCQNANFPVAWQLPTCTAAAATTTAATTTMASTAAPGSTTGSATQAATTTKPTSTTTAASGGAGRVSAKAWEHFELLSRLRASGYTCPGGTVFAPNAKALRFDCRLWLAAKLHSEDMATNNYFSHTSLDGRTPWDRARAAGTTANGENIAAGGATANSTLEQFKRSDGHCKNLMNPAFEVAAIGNAEGGFYGYYWTQMFRNTGDVDATCYPAPALAQASPATGAAGDVDDKDDKHGKDEGHDDEDNEVKALAGEAWTYEEHSAVAEG